MSARHEAFSENRRVWRYLARFMALVMVAAILQVAPASAIARNNRPDIQDDVPVEGYDLVVAGNREPSETAEAAVTNLGEVEWPKPEKVETELAAPSSARADSLGEVDEGKTVAVTPVDEATFEEWVSPLPQDDPDGQQDTINDGGDTQNSPEFGPSVTPAPTSTPSAQPTPAPQDTGSDEPAEETEGPAETSEENGEETPTEVETPPSDEAEPARSAAVEILDRQTAEQAGITGLLLRVTRTDGVDTTAPVQISIDYSTFASSFGADYASRLDLVVLDDCVLDASTPECIPEIPLEATNNTESMTLSAVAPASAGTGVLLAAVPGGGGGNGDYKATQLSPSSTWDVGLQSGGFSWSYPMTVPPVAGGLVPDVSLDYESAGVDGRTASSNNQTSWIGEGFDYWPGYIERSYKLCQDDGHQVADQCWGRHNATLSLNGKATELILDSDGTWHMRSDDGSKIERLTGTSNGDNDGEYWKVTTTDGTQYFFGRNRLPGWSSGDPETKSTWTVPVYGDDSGEPCHGSTFANSWCQQAWRWNLDYVVDMHGNVITYWYEKERNHYGRNLTTTATPYDRGGYLKRIDYGLRSDDVYATAPARVNFTVGERCIPTNNFDCAPSKLTTANASHWPDVPFDQNCEAGASCTTRHSATFWSRKKLDKITTQVHNGTEYVNVDSWTLEHAFPAPGDGTTPALWLQSIQHTGHVGGTATVPKVTFEGTALENRVDGLSDGLAPMLKYRITSIYTESGAQTDISYSAPECTRGSTPQPHANTKRCYPVIWTPPGEQEMTDWFHKYVVTQVAELDLVADQPDTITTYQYLGGGAWHYDDADGLVPESRKTWSQWRGYGQVRVVSGEQGNQQSEEEHLFFRGMHGDKQPSGTRSVTVTDSEGGTHTDSDELSGMTLEVITRDGPGGDVVSKTITTPWSLETAARSYSWGTLRAHLVNVATIHTYIATQNGWQQTRAHKTYDEYGFVTETHDEGDLAVTDDDRCIRSTYVRNTAKHLLETASRIETVAVPCDETPSTPDDVISDVRLHYDGQAFGATPTRGRVTLMERIADHENGSPVYRTISSQTYDSYGRLLTVTDPLDNVTTVEYSSDVQGGTATTITMTNALGHQTVQELDPLRALPVEITDQNNNKTHYEYDPLGRTTAVWLPDRNKNNGAAPSIKYSYHLSKDAPTYVVTETLRNGGGYNASYEIYDGLLRLRQTQQPAPGGGRVLTDVFHDSRGLAVKERDVYYNEHDPSGNLFIVNNDDDIPRQTETVYDGAERPTDVIHVSRGEEQWRTSVQYLGDRTLTTTPEGGIGETVITDVRGQVIERRQHYGNEPAGDYEAITYTYTPGGHLAEVTDAAGNVWEYSYDLRGRQVEMTDPDSGTTTISYNDLDQVVSTTDARGETLAYTYDELGRNTGVFEGDTSGPKRAEWVYDTLAKGQLSSSTRFEDGQSYTTRVLGYDSLDRPKAYEVVIPSAEGMLAGRYRYTLVYNEDGTLQSLKLPAAGGLGEETLVHDYNELGMPTLLQGLQNRTYVSDTVYSKIGNLVQRELHLGHGDKTWMTREFDPATNRLEAASVVYQVGSGSLTTQRYTYDDIGNILRIDDEPTNGAPADVQCFDYDGLRRLTEVWTPNTTGEQACEQAPSTAALGGPAPYWNSYTYDAAGNRTSEAQHGSSGDVVRSYTHPDPGDSQPHTVTEVAQTGPGGNTTETYTYDAAGNMTDRVVGNRVQELEWDPEGLLSQVTEGPLETSYIYNAEGERLIRDENGAATLYLPGMEVTWHKGQNTVEATRYYEHAGEVVAVRNNDGTLNWVFSDHQGTGFLAVNAVTGQSVQRRSTVFGEDRGTTGTWPGERGFVNGTVDSSTGLTRLGAREYDPQLGRFISVDPLIDTADSQQMHGYSYASNSPVTFSDPDGLLLCERCGAGKSKGSSPQKPAKGSTTLRPKPKPATGRASFNSPVSRGGVGYGGSSYRYGGGGYSSTNSRAGAGGGVGQTAQVNRYNAPATDPVADALDKARYGATSAGFFGDFFDSTFGWMNDHSDLVENVIYYTALALCMFTPALACITIGVIAVIINILLDAYQAGWDWSKVNYFKYAFDLLLIGLGAGALMVAFGRKVLFGGVVFRFMENQRKMPWNKIGDIDWSNTYKNVEFNFLQWLIATLFGNAVKDNVPPFSCESPGELCA